MVWGVWKHLLITFAILGIEIMAGTAFLLWPNEIWVAFSLFYFGLFLLITSSVFLIKRNWGGWIFTIPSIRAKKISWAFNKYNFALSSFRDSVGTSEDMMLYGEVGYRIPQFQVKGTNNSKQPIEHVAGYIRSDLTNQRIPILLESRPPEETYGIPGKCEFWVRAIFPNSDGTREGYTLEDFWRHFGGFTFVFEYDEKRFEKKFPKAYIEKRIDDLKLEADSFLPSKDAPRVKFK